VLFLEQHTTKPGDFKSWLLGRYGMCELLLIYHHGKWSFRMVYSNCCSSIYSHFILLLGTAKVSSFIVHVCCPVLVNIYIFFPNPRVICETRCMEKCEMCQMTALYQIPLTSTVCFLLVYRLFKVYSAVQ